MKYIYFILLLSMFAFAETKTDITKKTNDTKAITAILPQMTNFLLTKTLIWTNGAVSQTNDFQLFPQPTLEMYLEVLKELQKMRDDIAVLKAK